jgi:hypothetical protein
LYLAKKALVFFAILYTPGVAFILQITHFTILLFNIIVLYQKIQNVTHDISFDDIARMRFMHDVCVLVHFIKELYARTRGGTFVYKYKTKALKKTLYFLKSEVPRKGSEPLY